MARYQYTATRKSDGAELHSGLVEDIDNQGVSRIARTVIAGLLQTHEDAKGLTMGDIKIEMSPIK